MLNRRTVLTGLGAVPLLQSQTRKYRTALIGSGWWGGNICREAMASGECEIVAVCDVDPSQLDKAVAEIQKLSGNQPKRHRDFRELLAQEKPEIVINATPDHWHPLITIAAVQSGAHVYVEKPISHTILEGKAMVAAARQHGRTVQVGTHRRVSPHNLSAMEFLRSGKVGKIGMVRAFVHAGGGEGQPTPESDPPAGMNWDMWCGPAPLRPYSKAIHPRGFRQFLDYANGTIGDWGIHWFDQILMWTEEKYPRRVSSTMARRVRRDSTDAPDTQVAQFDFENFTAVWEHRHYAANPAEKHSIGVYFYGTNGTFHLGWRDGWTFYPLAKGASEVHVEPTLHEPDQQNIKELWANFLQSIKARQEPASDIEKGFRSTSMSLLAMVAARTGRTIQWDGPKVQIVGDAEASKLLSRPYRKPWEYPKA